MGEGGGSWLLLEEHFESGDRRFLDELYASDAEKKLRAFADKWWKDARPFAREMLLAYIADGCDRPHHRPLVKKLFKNAEEAGDDRVMAAFLVAFDRLLGRKLVDVPRYDWATGQVTSTKMLKSSDQPRNTYVAGQSGRFTLKTRTYLARRAFRWFRGIARKDRERYFKAATHALMGYRDEHLMKPEQLLDSWGLIHLLYHGSAVIERHPMGARVAKGAALAHLEPAPYLPEVWRGRFDAVLSLFERAPARTVRTFARRLLETEYTKEVEGLELGTVRRLLKSPHDDVQLFAIERLKRTPGVETLALDEWLELLAIDHPIALPVIVELFEMHVSPDRLDLEQCVQLARSPAGPVAALGVRRLKAQRIHSEPQLRAVLPVVEARAPLAREEAASWLIELLDASPVAKPEHLREVVDARFADARAKSLPLLEKPRWSESPVLWLALAESPYPEIREFLIRHLEARIGGFGEASLRHLWASAILAIHRGGRAKRKVLDQICDRMVKDGDAAGLAPLLRAALRSVRAPERRGALAAVARAALENPELRRSLANFFPELELGAEESVCR